MEDTPNNETEMVAQPEMVVDYKSYKWLVSSCLQKSLRRGRWDLAESYVRFLWEHERNYLTYRLGTILAEDVGVANISLINEYLQTGLAKKKIDEKGGLDFILDIVQRSCESAKDRSSCDAGYYSYYSNFHPDSLDSSGLEKIFADPQEHYVTRIQAGWIMLGGHKFKHDGLNFNLDYPLNDKGQPADNIEGYQKAIERLTSNNEFAQTVINAYATEIENISLGMPIVQALWDKEALEDKGEGKLKVGQIIENTYVKETEYYHPTTGLNFISSGIDGHTREGKGAYFRYLKTKNDFVDYLKSKDIPEDRFMDVLSHCMFRTEGHEVNKRIYFPSAVTIMRDCEQRILNAKIDTDVLDFSTIKKILIADMPKINLLRKQAIEKMPTPMIEKVEPKKKVAKKKPV
jgi:hypothetical protein